MKEIQSLEKLLSSAQQYRSKALLEPDEFMELFDNCLIELQITKKIDSVSLRRFIKKYLLIADWFKSINSITIKALLREDFSTIFSDNKENEAQYLPYTYMYVDSVVIALIKDRHREVFGTLMPELYGRYNGDTSDIKNMLHIAKGKDGNIIATVETIASSIAELYLYYTGELISDGQLPELSLIEKAFDGADYANPNEEKIIQVLKLCVDLYLKQYVLSSIFLPYRGYTDDLSENIDAIYESYSKENDQAVQKIIAIYTDLYQDELTHRLGGGKFTNSSERAEVTVSKQEHPEAKSIKTSNENDEEKVMPEPSDLQMSDNNKITKITDNLKTGENEKQAEPTAAETLSPMVSEPQPLHISDEPIQKTEKTEEPKPQDLYEQYCERKISDDEYKISDNFYLRREHGKFLLIQKLPTKSDTNKYITASKVPYFIIARTEHLETGVQGVRIAALKDGKLDKAIDISLGEADSKKVATTLRNKGILVDSPKASAAYIDEMYQQIERQIFISDNVGWVEHAGQFGFVMPDDKGIGITGLEYNSAANQKLKFAIEESGDLDLWLSIFDLLDLEKADTRIQFLLFSALLPLFANYHPAFEGFSIHIMPDTSRGGSTSSNGKTSLQKLMLSLQGNVPEWFTNWNKTYAGMEQYLYSNVGAYLDDTKKAKSMKKGEFEDIIYSISDAQSRGTDNKQPRTRKTVLFSSGETTLLQHVPDDGAYVRYVDVAIKGSDYGIDEDKLRKYYGLVHKTVDSNFGFVYPVAIRVLLDNRDEITKRADTYIEKIGKEGGYENAERLARRYGMIAVCGEVFIEVMRKLTGTKNLYSKLDPYKVALDMFLTHDQRLVGMSEKEYKISEDMLGDLLSNFQHNDSGELIARDNKQVGFIDNSTYSILSSTVKSCLPEGMTKTTFSKLLEEKGLLLEKSKNISRDGKTSRYDIFLKKTEE